MGIQVGCGKCGQQYMAPDTLAGKRTKCPKCGETVAVPTPTVNAQPVDMMSNLLNEELNSDLTAADPMSGPFTATPGSPFGRPMPKRKRAKLGRAKLGRRTSGKRGPKKFQLNPKLVVVVVAIACCGLFIVLVLSAGGGGSVDLGNPNEPFATASVPLPGFPERSAARTLMPGVNIEDVLLTVPGSGPGHYNRLQVFTPPGDHEAHSLPCVLIAPAGTNLLSGCRLGNDADHPERTPYVLAGYAVVAYELDGEYTSDEPTNSQMRAAYQEFAAAQAGLTNARNALEFVLAKMPEVDPSRIYSAGHSSAATLAVLFAEHEPRLRACVAFAPVSDVVANFSEDATLLRMLLPGSADFFVKSSPKTHAANLGCPLLLFHANDDSVVPIAQTHAFSRTLQGLGKDVTLRTVSSGDHYDSMIEQGIPTAIEWLAGHGGGTRPTARHDSIQ